MENLTERSPWCFVSRTAEVGDALLIYVSSTHHSTLPECALGIVAMYEILGSVPERVGDSEVVGQSSMGGGIVVPMHVALIQRFAVPLSLKDMRADRILKKARYFGHNFRGICFRVPYHEYVQIISLVAAKGVAQSRVESSSSNRST